MIRDSIDPKNPRQAWQYLVGQRRVRRAPTVAYDTPDFVASGANYFDEVQGFLGHIDRYQWKLVGKREMYIPYNDNGLVTAKLDEAFTKHHMNPDKTRWELHRVWVVEATVAAGKRHAVPKRRFYLDEDSWALTLMDGYDAEGNLTTVTDANNRVTTTAYDSLNRPKTTTLPAPTAGGSTPVITTTYDGLDQPKQVTDPRSLNTIYTTDGLGNTTVLASPDTGTSSATFDVAGHLISRTDARSKTTTYTYDALDRLKTITYASGTPSTYTYDGGSSPYAGSIGQLTGLTDETGSTQFTYDALSRLTAKTQVTNGRSFSVGYAWGDSGSALNKLLTLTYPSGAVVTYAYGSDGRVSQVSVTPAGGAATTVLSNLAYTVDGQVLSWFSQQHAEALLRAAGCPKINLQVRSTNTALITFYESIAIRLRKPGTAVVGATTMIFSIIVSLTHGLQATELSNLSILHPPFLLGLITGGAVIYWFTGASTQAVTTGAYRAVEFIKKNIKLEGTDRASIADSKKVVEICTQYAQKGMFNIFLTVFFASLGFAFIDPYSFIGYLISIALFGLYQAIFMANAGGAWDNAKKFIESGGLKAAKGKVLGKGSDAHAAAVVGDTVGDPYKDTAGPSLHVLVKLLATVTLVLAPLFIGAA